MIISASRRTDIPAFYAEWFMNQVRNQVILRKNPYNDQIYTTSLKPEDVDCIVFWTRNAKKMITNGYLDELDDLGIPYYFQYTVTGYKKGIEKSTLHPLKAIDNINELAEKIGGNKIIWRFDPMFMSEYTDNKGNQIITDVNELIRLHEKIASSIDSNISENVISFLDDYQKTGNNLRKAGVMSWDLLNHPEHLDSVLSGISSTANKYNLNVTTCAENVDLEKYGISKGKCIDDDFIRKNLGIEVLNKKDRNQRKECGCIQSVDVGVYDTCIHGCEYCYATQSQNQAKDNYKKHDPMNQFIIPDSRFQISQRII